MTQDHVDVDELDRYLDGEVSENRAAMIRDHLTACASCRKALEGARELVADLAAPVAMPNAALVARIVQRLDEAPAPARWAPRWQWASGATAVAALAVAVLLVATRTRSPSDPDPTTMQARGGGSSASSAGAIARHVGLTIYRMSLDRERLDDGGVVTPNTVYGMAYRNVASSAPLYLLAFAIDSHDAIHWLYPAYLDPATDPLAVPLPRASRETSFTDSVTFDDVATGPLRIVTIVAPHRLRISAIEGLRPPALARAALAQRFHDAAVHELVVDVSARLDGDPR